MQARDPGTRAPCARDLWGESRRRATNASARDARVLERHQAGSERSRVARCSQGIVVGQLGGRGAAIADEAVGGAITTTGMSRPPVLLRTRIVVVPGALP